MLRYQLQQKRRMLNEIKEELEYCRRKWALAREKNNESQSQWNSLRLEFTNRKLLDENNSAESGFSDDLLSDEETTANTEDKERAKSPLQNKKDEKESMSIQPIAGLTEVYQTPIEIDVTDIPLNNASVKLEPISKLEYSASTHFEPTLPIKESVSVRQNIIVAVAGSSASTSTKTNEDKSKVLSAFVRKESKKNKKKKKSKNTEGETLEQMFYRISGQVPEECDESESDDDEEIAEIVEIFEEELNCADALCNTPSEAIQEVLQDEVEVPIVRNVANNLPVITMPPVSLNTSLGLEDDERRELRAARFKRLEEQCQQLITQVVNTSSRGDKLNLQLDQVQRRYKPADPKADIEKETTPDICEASTSSTAAVSTNDTEDSCLTQREQEYTSRRAERLKRLEEECKAFLNNVNTSHSRACAMNTKLEVLHDRYEKKNGPRQKSTAESSLDENDSEANTSQVQQFTSEVEQSGSTKDPLSETQNETVNPTIEELDSVSSNKSESSPSTVSSTNIDQADVEPATFEINCTPNTNVCGLVSTVSSIEITVVGGISNEQPDTTENCSTPSSDTPVLVSTASSTEIAVAESVHNEQLDTTENSHEDSKNSSN